MRTSGRDDDATDGEVEEESADANIERLATEIAELKASLIGVPESSGEWYQIKMNIKDRDGERLVHLEKKRCDGVVHEYFEQNPHVLEAAPECPVCLEKMWEGFGTLRYVCCGKLICKKCDTQGGVALNTCPLCRGKAPRLDEMIPSTKAKADSGIAWAQAAMGENYFDGRGVPKDVEKGLSLLNGSAEKGSTRAKNVLGEYYYAIENYKEARTWFEAAAAEGFLFSLYQLGRMMKNGEAFDNNEETQAEAFRLLTISATLLHGYSNKPAAVLASFFHDSYPVMLHYLRPAVVEGNATVQSMNLYAMGLYGVAIEYYGKKVVWETGHSPVPEALFWYRQCSRSGELDAGHPFVKLERAIRNCCAHCRAKLPEGKRSCCVECKAAFYCGRNCQMSHWKAGHKQDCVKKLKKKLRAEGKLDEEK